MEKHKYSLAAEVGGRIWALWGMISFAVTITLAMLFFWPCFLMKEPRAAHWHYKVAHVWMYIFLNSVACPLSIKNARYFLKGQNYVIVCNHNSFMDIFSASPFTPNPNKTIAKKDFAWIPILGWVYRLGSVLVDRKSIESRKQSYLQMKAVLAMGLDMIIYPEGTRNKTDEPIGIFQDGAFRLAKQTGKPIMPTVIFNSGKILPHDKTLFMMPHRLHMHFLPPVSPQGITVRDLKDTIHRQMSEYYEENKSLF